MPSSEIEVYKAIALDVDRTLIDTNVAFEGLATACRKSGMVDEAKMRSAKRDAEDVGDSFGPIDHLTDTEHLTVADINQLMTVFKAQPLTGLVYPDAERLLYRISRQRTIEPGQLEAFLLTRGNPLFQDPKIEAMIEKIKNGFFRFEGDLPSLVTDRGDKGQMIDEMATTSTDGKRAYRIAPSSGAIIIAQTVTLVEDYYPNVIDMPDDGYAYVVDRPNGKITAKPDPNQIAKNIELVQNHDYIYVNRTGSF